jgi:hypothetical protein
VRQGIFKAYVIIKLKTVKTTALKIVQLVRQEVSCSAKLPSVTTLPQFSCVGEAAAIHKIGEVYDYQLDGAEVLQQRSRGLIGFQLHRSAGLAGQRLPLLQCFYVVSWPAVFHDGAIFYQLRHRPAP